MAAAKMATPETTSSDGVNSDSNTYISDTDLERRTSAVRDLARTFSAPGNPFAGQDEALDPSSDKFNARRWAQAMANMEGVTNRSTGICFEDVNVYGVGESSDFQMDLISVWFAVSSLARKVTGAGRQRIDILRDFDGLVEAGEILAVLGPPGSGCSTFLKTVAGELNGIHVEDGAYINYHGMEAKEMHTHHRGEAIYTAEVDVHFPELTVGDTLTFAAHARQSSHLPAGVDRNRSAEHMRDVTMAMFGISHTVNSNVGNDFIRGVSGGERKRVTIAEASLSGAPFQCWDNSTRGLDSATAVEFCKTLRLQADTFRTTSCVSLYQAPQAAYSLFDKVTVIYEGRQIFFGRTEDAKQYFIDLGFECPQRQTTPDFLTSMASAHERIVRPGFEGKVPRTADDFAAAWKRSSHYQQLQADIRKYKETYPMGGSSAQAFREHKKQHQASHQRAKSPYTISYAHQVQLCLWRGWRRFRSAPSVTVGGVIGNIIIALIVGSAFYNMDTNTSSFPLRGALLFFAIVLNGFSAIIEITTLYAQRPIVEKHSRYALYHTSAEAIASMITDLPFKLLNTIALNTVLYFMTNLRREPGPYFFFLLLNFCTIIMGSMIFRTIASTSRSVFQAQVPAAVSFIGLMVFTGFVIPQQDMPGWCRWISYINPLRYAFEAAMANEFYGRRFLCNGFVPAGPAYSGIDSNAFTCSSIGSVPGQNYVSGETYISEAFGYHSYNKWRNIGIILAFAVFFMFAHILAAEHIAEKKSKGEVLLYRRGNKPAIVAAAEKNKSDREGGFGPSNTIIADKSSGDQKEGAILQAQTSIFQWQDVCYDIQIKKETRRILDHVDGWVKPGTLTALMGVSGAGKTTLLDCLADRVSIGVLTGDILVDGKPRDPSFQRKTGYVQQQDLHLHTSTVREALNFSAILRQPSHIPRQEKLAYVDDVIKMLDMEEYAEAVIGVPGEGLNVEQRKRVTIGVELVAKPPLLVFVDEPTSGLDSQTSWAILDLLEKLTKAGQAVLCTIHQPSAMLFERFDRLLFLARGGKTVYFGDIGRGSRTMLDYFESKSGLKCPESANPAEWMLEAIGAAPGSHSDIDWFQTWRDSDEYQEVKAELQRIQEERLAMAPPVDEQPTSYEEFAAPFSVQLRENLVRIYQQYWRTPVYIYSKLALCTLIALFVGFTFFRAQNSIQGLKNQMFAIFCIFNIFNELVSQIMPQFSIQRALYEAREFPSKVYSWKVFMLSQILADLPWNILVGTIMYFCWYYPIGLYRNAAPTDAVGERGVLMWLFIVAFMVFTGTFTLFCAAGTPNAEGGARLAQLLFIFCIVFCGVLVTPEKLPRFWIFMYRVSPFTYMISGMLAAGLGNTRITCAKNELLTIQPAGMQTCGEYLQDWIYGNQTVGTPPAGGYLLNQDATSDCQFCPMSETNAFLTSVSSNYGDRWRNFGIVSVYIIFNIFACLLFYWVARVPKGKKTKQV